MTRILVIETEPRARHALRNMLVDAGYEVELAADGRDAARRQASTPVDLVIADGIEPPPAGAPVLAVPGRAEGCRLSAGWAMLPKPFRRDDLLAAVQSTLNGASQGRGTRI